MKTKIRLINGMPVEVPVLDLAGELERKKLNALALKEYEETGKLSSQKLREACADFEQKFTLHVVEEKKEEQTISTTNELKKDE